MSDWTPGRHKLARVIFANPELFTRDSVVAWLGRALNELDRLRPELKEEQEKGTKP